MLPATSADTMRRRARHLPEADRVLLELVDRKGLTQAEVAVLLGRSPGWVSRRRRRLVGRLRDPMVAALVEAPEAEGLDVSHREIGIKHFLLGRSARQLAEERGVPATQVRGVLEFLRGWLRGVHV